MRVAIFHRHLQHSALEPAQPDDRHARSLAQSRETSERIYREKLQAAHRACVTSRRSVAQSERIDNGIEQWRRTRLVHYGLFLRHLIEPGPFRTDFQGRSIKLPNVANDAYAETAGARHKQLRDSHGKQAGDPERAADAIIKVVESADPPLHLLLGKIALDRARDTINEHLRSIDAWESVTLSADYPK